MKSTVSKSPCTEKSFPKLMISIVSNVIAIATSKSTLIVVTNEDSINKIGCILNVTPNEFKYWKDYHGSVCLEND